MAFGTPLSVLNAVMTSSELVYWMAYDEIDPISLHHRVDLAAGVVASANVNKSIGKENADKATTPLDFMPILRAREKEAEDRQPKKTNIKALREFLRGKVKGK